MIFPSQVGPTSSRNGLANVCPLWVLRPKSLDFILDILLNSIPWCWLILTFYLRLIWSLQTHQNLWKLVHGQGTLFPAPMLDIPGPSLPCFGSTWWILYATLRVSGTNGLNLIKFENYFAHLKKIIRLSRTIKPYVLNLFP